MFILETIQAQLILEMKQILLDFLVTYYLFLSRSSRAKGKLHVDFNILPI